jgi:BASS family bile acid:Na+ symporter
VNQDLILALALPVTLFCIMFGMGAGLTLDDFRRLHRTPGAVLTGIGSQMLLLPLLALLTVTLFRLPPEIAVGFMILAFSPGGTTSNLFSYLASGNLALSISLTAIVSLITPISLPLLSGVVLEWQLGSMQEIVLPFGSTFAKLVLVTLIPVVLGMLLRHYRPEFCVRNEKWLTRVPMVMLLLVIAGIIHQNWARMPVFLQQTGAPSLLLASLALIGGYLLAGALRQSARDARTVAIETGIQNGGTAILVTGTILDNPTMTIAPVMYGILMLLPTIGYVVWMNARRSFVLADLPGDAD